VDHHRLVLRASANPEGQLVLVKHLRRLGVENQEYGLDSGDWGRVLGPATIRSSKKIRRLAPLAFIALIASAWGQSEPGSIPEALALLERAAHQYSDLKSYRIREEETYSSEHPPDPPPSKMTAIEASGGRYRFEGDIGWGNAIQVSDGHCVWYCRPTQNAYTRRPATGNKPDLPKILSPDDAAVEAAADLHDMTAFLGTYKSAKRLT
jgi:hypothetical protein